MWRWSSPEKQRYRLANLVQDLFGEWTVDSVYPGQKLREHPPPYGRPA
jgi:hypothetical protein